MLRVLFLLALPAKLQVGRSARAPHTGALACEHSQQRHLADPDSPTPPAHAQAAPLAGTAAPAQGHLGAGQEGDQDKVCTVCATLPDERCPS